MSTPVLLIGGLGVHSIDWGPLIPCLSNRVVFTTERHALTMDVSILDPDDPIALADWEIELENLVEQLQEINAPAIVVGHSMGAILAEALARLYPELVTRLVLVDGSSPLRFKHDGDVEPSPGRRIRAHNLQGNSRFGARLMAFVARLRGHGEQRKNLFTRLYGNKVAWRQVVVEFFEERTWAHQLQHIAQDHPLTAPVSVVVALGGFGPKGYWVKRQRRYFEQLPPHPGHRFYTIDDASHMVMMTHPEELAEIIMED